MKNVDSRPEDSGREKESDVEEIQIQSLTTEKFDDLIAILQEINEEPLGAERLECLTQDFAEGRFVGLQIYEKGNLAGMAIVVDSYSTVHAQKVLQLDELYIKETFRSKGLGKTLFDAVIEYAKSKGYMRLEWRTGMDNEAAQNLYSQYPTNSNWKYYLLEL